MSDREAFLCAIRAEPDDDTARLAFADWLDEHGEPERAEFIRVQVELEPVRYRIDNPRAVELHKREDELLRAHGDDWLGTDHLLTNPADFGPVFRRGFPDYACLSLDTFLQNGEALFAAHPTLREVALYGLANRCSDLTMSPLLAKLDTLEIADWLTEDDAISLSVSPHLDRIKRFKLWLGGIQYFPRELVKQATARWPREIELVQVYGGVACGNPEAASELSERADRIARLANERLGREAVRVTRPFEQLFPLNGEVGYRIYAGHLPDGRPALVTLDERLVLVTFTDEGLVSEVEVRDNPLPNLASGDGVAQINFAAAFLEWITEELRLELGLIRVREFAVEDLRVELFTRHRRDDVADSSAQPPHYRDARAWRERGGQIRGWLERRDFLVFHLGDDYWADWRGKIHSS